MPSFLSFLESEAEGQSSDPVVAAARSEEEHPLPKSLDEDGEADAVTKAIGTCWPTARAVPNCFWPLLLATHYDQVLSTFLASTNILSQSTAISYYMYSQTSSSLP